MADEGEMDMKRLLNIKKETSENHIVFKNIIENISEVFWIKDMKNDAITYVSPSYEKIWGRSCESLHEDSESLVKSVHVEDRKKVEEAFERMKETGEDFSEEFRIVRGDGTLRWVWCRVFPTRDEGGAICKLVGIAEDMTRLKEVESRLMEIANKDYLTGANNRNYFFNRASEEFEASKTSGRKFTILMLDLDGFKKVNDKHGHHTGDMVLKKMVELCKSQIRSTDVFARFGGEEFTLMLADTRKEEAIVIAERLRMELASIPVETEVGVLYFTVSTGVSEFSDEDENVEDMIMRADRALYMAKNSGRNKVCHA